MKQNFLLKSFVLLIALLAGGISAWADPTYHYFTSGGLTVLSTSYVDTWANNSMSGYWMVHNGTASKELSLTDELKTSWNTTESKITFYQVKTSGSKDLTLYFTNVTSITVYSHSNGSSSRTLQYKLNGGEAVNLHEYSSSSFSSDEITGLNASTNYSLQFIASNDVEICAIAVTVPASGKDPSAFDLTSETSVTLWKGETSAITYSDAAGTVTFESSDADVATVDADGVITAVSEGTAVITVSDSGSETVDGANKTINVTVNEHKNTTTTNIPGASGATVLMTNSIVSGNVTSATLKGVATIYDMTGNTGVQQGSSQTFDVGEETGLTGIKLSGSRRIGIKPEEGITITKVTCYVRSNGTNETSFQKYYDASGNTQELETAVTIPAKNAADPAVIDMTDYITNGFRFESQSQAVFEIEYSSTQQMQVTIKETGYATLFTDYAVAIPEGVEAFTGKYNAETQTVQLSAVTGTIPASTAVILHTKTPGSYSFVKADDVAAIANNDLVGTLVEKNVEAKSVYTLGLGGADNTVGMRLYNGTTIRAYSAYMEIPNATTIAPTAPFLSIGFGEEGTTGIRSIDNGQLTIDNVYYDLAGRRVAQPSKGVYIVNGKKVVIK